MHRNLCAGGKRNGAINFGAGSGGNGFREDDEAAKIELTYSTTSAVNRARPTLGRLIVCIIQVSAKKDEVLSRHFAAWSEKNSQLYMYDCQPPYCSGTLKVHSAFIPNEPKA